MRLWTPTPIESPAPPVWKQAPKRGLPGGLMFIAGYILPAIGQTHFFVRSLLALGLLWTAYVVWTLDSIERLPKLQMWGIRMISVVCVPLLAWVFYVVIPISQPPSFPSSREIADEVIKRLPVSKPLSPVVETDPQRTGEPTRRVPNVVCSLNENLSPCELSCSITNANKVALHDTTIGFNSLLPWQTTVAARPEARVTFVKSDTLPVPDPGGKRARHIRAFTVHVPMVPPTETVSFTLWTDSSNNRRSCLQEIGIQRLRKTILKDFYTLVLESGLSLPPLEDTMTAQAIDSGLFSPDGFSSEIGSGTVRLKSRAQIASQEEFQKVYSELKAKFSDAWRGRKECLAPVYTAEETGGTPITFASFPPDINTSVVMAFRLPDAPKGTTVQIDARPPVPKEYDCLP
jgi:hypothetical protein